jgi:hypothetical protein
MAGSTDFRVLDCRSFQTCEGFLLDHHSSLFLELTSTTLPVSFYYNTAKFCGDSSWSEAQQHHLHLHCSINIIFIGAGEISPGLPRRPSQRGGGILSIPQHSDGPEGLSNVHHQWNHHWHHCLSFIRTTLRTKMSSWSRATTAVGIYDICPANSTTN